MTKFNDKKRQRGLILIELLTAMAVFAVSVVTIFTLFVNATTGIIISLNKTKANLLSNETLEAASSILKHDPDYLTPGKYEIGINNENQWVLISQTGLMGHFLLADNVQDSSPYKNNVEAQNISFVEDRKSQPEAAAGFNGNNSYIKTEYALSLQIEGPLTISAWVLDTGIKGNPFPRTIAEKYDASKDEGGYILYKVGNDYYFKISGTEGIASVSAPSAQQGFWELVTAVYDPGKPPTLRLYVNGQLNPPQNTIVTAINKAPGIEFFIGNDAGLSSPWQGRISDVRVYNRALTSNEISGLYGNYSVEGQKALVVSDIDQLAGIWSFNEGEGCVANDNSGNNNHGIIENCSSTQWVEDKNGNAGRAFNFENNNYIEIADSPTLQIKDQISISLWIKIPENHPQGNMIILRKKATGAEDFSFALTYQNDKEGYAFAIATGTPSQLTQITLPGSVVPDRWQNLIFTFSSTSTEIYVDNQKVSSNDLTNFDNAGANSNLFIGAADGQNNLSGAIDDLRIYNKILDSSEREAIFLEKPAYYLE